MCPPLAPPTAAPTPPIGCSQKRAGTNGGEASSWKMVLGWVMVALEHESTVGWVYGEGALSRVRGGHQLHFGGSHPTLGMSGCAFMD